MQVTDEVIKNIGKLVKDKTDLDSMKENEINWYNTGVIEAIEELEKMKLLQEKKVVNET